MTLPRELLPGGLVRLVSPPSGEWPTGDTGVVGGVTAGGGAAAAEFFKVGGAGGFFLSVVDVPVIVSEKLQQSIVHENLEVPQIQFVDRVVDFQLCSSVVFPQCILCRRPARSHRWCSWTRLRRPLLYNDRCLGYDSAENCEIPQLQC